MSEPGRVPTCTCEAHPWADPEDYDHGPSCPCVAGRTPSPEIGTESWSRRRALLWREDAEALVERLREYEECHPPVGDGVPCFGAALIAAERAMTARASTSSDQADL